MEENIVDSMYVQRTLQAMKTFLSTPYLYLRAVLLPTHQALQHHPAAGGRGEGGV
jgi:hypothetical protein